MTTATLPPPPALRAAPSEPRSPAPASPRSPNSESRPPSAAAPAALRLSFWSTHHEVRPSRRTWERLDQVPLPTRHDTLGFRLLATQPDAAALLAAWTLLVQVSARLPRPLRGLLVTDTGYAYTAADLALMTGFSADFFARAFAFFQQPDVAWLASAPADAIPAALEEIKHHRAAEQAREAERYAQAAARRRERQATRRLAANPSAPDLRSSDSDLRPAGPAGSSAVGSAKADATAPNVILETLVDTDACMTREEAEAAATDPARPVRTFAPLPTPPPDWRALLLGLFDAPDPDEIADCERLVWSDIPPRFQHHLHLKAA